MRPSLPPDFAWHPLYPDKPEGSMVIRIGDCWGREVARVNQRVDGPRWVSEVNRHAHDWKRRRHALHPSREQAMRMAECWVVVRIDRIRADIAAEPPREGVRYAVIYDRGERDNPGRPR